MSSTPDPQFLVVEDDARIAQSVAWLLAKYGNPLISHSLAEARAVLADRGTISGVILDVGLPDGSGFELLEEVRNREVPIPTMVLSGDSSPDALRRALLYGALFAPKPISAAGLVAFVDWSTGNEQALNGLLRQVDRFAHRFGLSDRERELVAHSARGVTRSDLRARLGVEKSTVKTMVRRVLKKTAMGCLGEVVAEVHRGVFVALPPTGALASGPWQPELTSEDGGHGHA